MYLPCSRGAKASQSIFYSASRLYVHSAGDSCRALIRIEASHIRIVFLTVLPERRATEAMVRYGTGGTVPVWFSAMSVTASQKHHPKRPHQLSETTCLLLQPALEPYTNQYRYRLSVTSIVISPLVGEADHLVVPEIVQITLLNLPSS